MTLRKETFYARAMNRSLKVSQKAFSQGFTFVAAIGTFLIFFTGCAALKSVRPSPTPVAPTVSPVRKTSVGVLVSVDRAGAFALLEGASFPTGTELHTKEAVVTEAPEATDPVPEGEPKRAGAVLRVSSERRPPFLVLDIVSGEPASGDAVFRNAQ